jgi:predicted ATPase/DNA-binding SARP family transcriptional activator
MLTQPWRIQLLGGLSAEQGTQVITRFKTAKTGLLLAYLAYFHRQPQARDTLAARFWPEADVDRGHRSLRVALTSLRHQLEPPGVTHGAVLRADKTSVQLNPAAFTTDVAEFEAALATAAQAPADPRPIGLLASAVERYGGALLPDHDADWVRQERERLANEYLGALERLIVWHADAGRYGEALGYAHRAVQADPLRERSYQTLMTLYARVGQPAAGLEQYYELARLLRQLGAAPSRRTRDRARWLEEQFAKTGEDLPAPADERVTPDPSRPQASSQRPSATTRPSRQSVSPSANPVVEEASGRALRLPGKVPLPLTRFFGREEELARLLELLAPVSKPASQVATREAEAAGSVSRRAPRAHPPRLVTLTGAGGTGKTRLAIEVAHRVRAAFPGGAWFVSLADTADPRRIASAVAETLDLARSPGVEPLAQVVEALSRQPSLLILDNFERLAASGAPLVQTLLQRIPTLTCLVTSRRRLALDGEQELPVSPLPTPPVSAGRGRLGRGEARRKARGGSLIAQKLAQPSQGVTPEGLTQFASVQLFVDRRRAVRPDFQVTEGNAAEVAALCDQLDGIPLAIELAAAQAQGLTPAQMREGLEKRFTLLRDRWADEQSRHRSLWATIAWSYDFLLPELQRFFTRISIFRGGWDLEAAETVCEERFAADYLWQLRAHSLVEADDRSGEPRFRLLDSIREFAEQELASAEYEDLIERHARYFLARAEEAEPHLTGADQRQWLDQLEREHDNLWLALERAAGRGPAEWGLRIAGALWAFWNARGHLTAGRERLQQALAGSPAEAGEVDRGASVRPARAKALHGAGVLASNQGDHTEGRALIEESLALRREQGDRHGEAHSLNSLGLIVWSQGDLALAGRLHEESLAIFRELDDKAGIAGSLNNLGRVAHHQGDMARVRAFYEESLVLQRELGDPRGTAVALNNLAVLAVNAGDHASARALLEECLGIFRELGDLRVVGMLANNLGNLGYAQGDYASARAYYEESLALERERGDQTSIARTLGSLGALFKAEGDYDTARSFHEESLAIKRGLGEKGGIALGLNNLGVVLRLQGAHARARQLLGESLALARELDDKWLTACILEELAAVVVAQGHAEEAARLFGAAEALREAIQSPMAPNERADYDREVASVRALLTEAAFDAAWAEGRAMLLAQILAWALGET